MSSTTKFEKVFSACPSGVRPLRPRLAAWTRLGPRRRRALAEPPAPARYVQRNFPADEFPSFELSEFCFLFDRCPLELDDGRCWVGADAQEVRGDQTPADFDMVDGDQLFVAFTTAVDHALRRI